MDGSSRPRAPQPAPPDRAFSFTDWQTAHPTEPPPGDKLDAELDRTNQAVEDVIDWVSTSLNSDGSLVEPPVTDPPPETGAVALAQDWADVSVAWAEHMPDTIPPNILANMAITGDHWSSRWWANRAAQIVQGQIKVPAWLPEGQPDGVTDNSEALQAALDAAAGCSDPAGEDPLGGVDNTMRAAAPGQWVLVIPAAPHPYIVGKSLCVPSHTHLIIEHGATIKLAPQTNDYMLLLVNNGTKILIELYGTLDGNASQQLFQPNPDYPATSTNPNTISGGITTERRAPIVVAGITVPIGSGVISHCKIIGDRNGLITNFMNWPAGLNNATNCEISGISMTNCAYYAGSAGVSSLGYNNPATITGGTYVIATGIVTLTTSIAHGIVPGEEIVTVNLTGSSGSWGAATAHVFIALPGTSGSTVVFKTAGGDTDGVITGGKLINWYMPQATVASGTYSPTTGVVTLTTTAPHYLNYDQLITANVTGTAGTIATGVFQLLDGSAGNTLRYSATRSGVTVNVVGDGASTYTDATGIVLLTTATPHGLTVGDIAHVALTGTGFLSGISHDHVVEAVPSTTQLWYTVAAGMDTTQLGRVPPGKIISITGGTVYGAPTQSIGPGAICVGTKSLNSGFDNCYFDNINDIGPCIYGGGINCYIRNSEITRNATGPYLFSDANLGRCVGCEISGNYVHDCGGVGAVNFGPAVALQHNLAHIDTRIFNNYITRCNGGIGLGNVDGVDVYNNRLYANRVNPLNTYGSTGDIVVGPRADRVRITGNTIRDPVQLSNSWRGSVLMQITSGTYDNVTGGVVLLVNVPPSPNNNTSLFGAAYFTVSNTTSSPGGLSVGVEGRQIGGAGTGKAAGIGTFEVHYTVPAGLGTFTITGGTVTPTGFGIAVHLANYLYIADNFIGDYQSTKTMLAAIGGQFGAGCVVTGNYYGPQINTTGNFPADMSVGSKRSDNFDVATGFTDGTTLTQPFSNTDPNETYPPLGLSVGYNRSGGRGETVVYLGAGNAGGGIDFIKVKGLAVSSGSYVSSVLTIASSGNTYDTVTGTTMVTTTVAHNLEVGGLIALSNLTGTVPPNDPLPAPQHAITDFNGPYTLTAVTGTTLTFIGPINYGTVSITGGNVNAAVVTLTTVVPHGLLVGSRFTFSLVLGFDTINPPGGPSTNLRDIQLLNGAWIATGDNAGTSGTTINFSLTTGAGLPNTGLDIQGILSGAINSSSMDGGQIDTSVGLPIGVGTGLLPGGSLLAVDGYANTRLSGALVHGAMQTATLTAGGTVTVNPNTSLVLVQNASSIATGSVVLPAPAASSYQLGGSILEVRFQNAVGALTMTAAAGASVAGPPTTVLSAGANFRFILSEPGNVWLPCLPDVSGTPPVGGPYLPLSGGGVTGATTFAALTTHAAGLTVSGGTLTAGSTTLTGTVTLPTTTTGPFLPLVGGIHSIAESGAVGDGTTDDQPAIQAWLNTLTNGAEVLLQPGKWYYIHAAPLYVPPHVTIRGAYNVRDNQFAGGGSTLFGAGGFYIDPALPVGIIMAAATTLRSLKVYRVGMTANANNTVAAADYATWTAEGVYKKTTALVGTGVTTIPLADTTGISTGMTVTGPGGFSPIGTSWPQYSTVTAINPGVSVTVSVGGNVAIASGSYLRFGKSTGIIVSRNCGGVVIDEVQIIGFRTGIQTFPGEFAISRGFGDCITNLECVTGADNGIIRDCEWLPLYGMPVSTQFVRAGDGVFVHDCAGPAFHDCYSIGWKINWHFENSSCWCYGCGGETPTDAGAGTENWTIRGGAQMSLFNCHAQTGGIGFHLDGSNQFQLVGCSGANAQITTANNTAHVLIENTIGAPVMTGSLIAPWSSSGYPSKVPIKYGSGTISGVTVSDVFMQDIVTPSPTAPFIQGTAPNPLNPGVYPGVVYQGSRVNGGTTAVPQYWHGVVIDSASNPLPTYTVQLPAFPSDRQSIDLWFNVAVTALTYTTTDGAAVGNYHNPAAGDQVQVIYQAGPNKWFVGG